MNIFVLQSGFTSVHWYPQFLRYTRCYVTKSSRVHVFFSVYSVCHEFSSSHITRLACMHIGGVHTQHWPVSTQSDTYVRNQYRRFAPHKHVSLCIVCSEASNVLWMMLTRRVHHSCARSWPLLWVSDVGHGAEPTVPVRRPLSLPWCMLQRKIAVSV